MCTFRFPSGETTGTTIQSDAMAPPPPPLVNVKSVSPVQVRRGRGVAPEVSVNKKKKESWRRVEASRKHQRSHHPLNRSPLLSFPTGHMMSTEGFCNDSNSNNKINNNNNNNNICPQRYLYTKSMFFFYKYKEIHRMILYTTYNKYCVSYILLFERMYVGGGLFCFVSFHL